MLSNVEITDQNELNEFVRTHVGHRLTAVVSPICRPQHDACWSRRNDAYRAAKEGSYGMLRLFIEFLWVKEDRDNPGTLKKADGEKDSIRLVAFSKWGAKKVEPKDFGNDGSILAKVHRTLCKINAHFTYDPDPSKSFYDRIVSPDEDKEWKAAVDIVVRKLDECFYEKLKQPIVVHDDLVGPFAKQFTGLRSCVKR
jgi:hypothetical protein